MIRARAAYWGNVSYIDEVIGDLLLRLETDGLLDNTIIVYTSDHGEMAGEHGVWWKNGWYEACTRVPMIISLPVQRRGKHPSCTCHVPVAQIDLFPTLCALARIDIPQGLDGVDLSKAVHCQIAPPERAIVCDALTPRWGAGTEFRMIRWQHYKYVVFRDAPPLFFDLANDPGEQRNLLAHDVPTEAQSPLITLKRLAAESIDFEAAECERVERDGTLEVKYRQYLPPATGNLYLMPPTDRAPLGKLVNADDILYNTTVISSDPTRAFGDFPQGQA
jgi:choline-sulfatase